MVGDVEMWRRNPPFLLAAIFYCSTVTHMAKWGEVGSGEGGSDGVSVPV